MTREEAIKAIQDFIGWFKEDSLIRKALEMAIQALSQVPCDDAISRQSIIDTYTSCADMLSDEELKGADLVMEWVNNAPPVTQKSGKWIDDEFGSSCCGIHTHIDKFDRHMKFKYCSMCGAKMVEPQEREDEE